MRHLTILALLTAPRGTAGAVRMLRTLLSLGLLLGCSDGRTEGGSPPAGETSAGDPPGPVQVRLEEVASGLESPVHLTAPAGDARLFVV